MKKRGKWIKPISWIGACMIFLMLFFSIALPELLQSGARQWARSAFLSDLFLKVDHANPWHARFSKVSGGSERIDFNLDQADLTYDPLDALDAKLESISLSRLSVLLKGDLLNELLGRFGESKEAGSEYDFEIRSHLASPPLRHLRLRDAELLLETRHGIKSSAFDLEGDFHEGLAQLRLDGNHSGVPWLADLTLVQEDQDLFMGAGVAVSDLRNFPEEALCLIESEKEEYAWLRNSLRFEQGRMQANWTGRLEDSEVLDQFLEVNATGVALAILGEVIELPKAFLFLNPLESGHLDASFFANLSWRDYLDIRGLKINLSDEGSESRVSGRLETLRSGGALPEVEAVGLVFEGIEFAYDEEETISGIRRADLRFSSLHFESGLYNLYDGEIEIEWKGEDRFFLSLRKANGSFPSFGLNFHNLEYSGEISLSSLPSLESDQVLSVEEAYVGEDLKVEDFKLIFQTESSKRVEVSELAFSFDENGILLSPANLVFEMPEDASERMRVGFFDAVASFPPDNDLSLAKIQGNLAIESFDPLETNGTQVIRFELFSGEREFKDGEFRFSVLSSGEVKIEQVRIDAFGGVVFVRETILGDGSESLNFQTDFIGLSGKELLACFKDVDAELEGNFSGYLNLSRTQAQGWDFSGGQLSLDSSEAAWLSLKLNGMLTKGLDPNSSYYEEKLLTEKALEKLELSNADVMFKVLENAERVVEMNIRGDAEVDGESISIEYKPKIIVGLQTLLLQADLQGLGILR